MHQLEDSWALLKTVPRKAILVPESSRGAKKLSRRSCSVKSEVFIARELPVSADLAGRSAPFKWGVLSTQNRTSSDDATSVFTDLNVHSTFLTPRARCTLFQNAIRISEQIAPKDLSELALGDATEASWIGMRKFCLWWTNCRSGRGQASSSRQSLDARVNFRIHR